MNPCSRNPSAATTVNARAMQKPIRILPQGPPMYEVDQKQPRLASTKICASRKIWKDTSVSNQLPSRHSGIPLPVDNEASELTRWNRRLINAKDGTPAGTIRVQEGLVCPFKHRRAGEIACNRRDRRSRPASDWRRNFKISPEHRRYWKRGCRSRNWLWRWTGRQSCGAALPKMDWLRRRLEHALAYCKPVKGFVECGAGGDIRL